MTILGDSIQDYSVVFMKVVLYLIKNISFEISQKKLSGICGMPNVGLRELGARGLHVAMPSMIDSAVVFEKTLGNMTVDELMSALYQYIVIEEFSFSNVRM